MGKSFSGNLYDRLLDIRLTLRQMGEEKEDMIVFSFWPDVIMIKEIGDPLQVAELSQPGSEGAKSPRDHGPGTTEYQLCH